MTRTKAATTGRKSDVLAAAAALFADQGYSAVGIDEIGELAGITGPGVYNHFDSKESLLAAVILDMSERIARVAEAAASSRPSEPRQALRRLVDLTTAMTLDMGDATQVYVHEAQSLRADDQRAVRQADERLLKVARELVSAANPGISDPSFLLRSWFVAAGVTAVARERALLRRPALQQIVSDAAFAVLQAPPPAPVDHPRKTTHEAAPWLTPPSRRDEILTLAAGLFARHGYHAVSMEDIGAAAGISAAAIYRHFANKAEIANEAFVRVGAHMIVGMERALRQASSPQAAIEGLVASLIQEAVEAGDLLAILPQAMKELDAKDAARELRGRRQMLDTWTHVLRVARPELREPHARVLARAGIGAITRAAVCPAPIQTRTNELPQLALALLHS